MTDEKPGSEFTARLEGWSVGYPEPKEQRDFYTPPEGRPVVLHGLIYGHPRFKDGSSVTTAPIVDADGSRITVAGSSSELSERYDVLLGQIHPEYRAWLKEHRPDWDPENPVTIFRN